MKSTETDHDEIMRDIIRGSSQSPDAPAAPQEDVSQYLNLQGDEDGANIECEEEIPQSTEASGSTKQKRKRGSKKKMQGCTIITAVAPDGTPTSPAGVRTTFTNQCGYLVREHIPIKFQFWKKSKKTPDADLAHIVPDTEKEMLWSEVLKHFQFPSGREGDVKKWAFKKMAIQFQTFKKNLIKNFVNKSLTPDFDKQFQNQRQWWDEFLQMKESQDSAQRIQRNTENARKKKDFHNLGPGGYALAIPKWEKMEEDMIARGIRPQTLEWPLRARRYFYAHGGTLDAETGMIVTSDALREKVNKLEDAMRRVHDGTFIPDRERDELSYALGNPEHTGRTRGMGIVPWKYGFAADIDSYRSRSRSKALAEEKFRRIEERLALVEADRDAARQAHHNLEQSMAEKVQRLEVALSQRQDQLEAPVVGLETSPASQRRSSIASTGAIPAQENEAAGDNERHLVDNIKERTSCDILYPRGKKLKVCGEGVAEVPQEGATYHCKPVPAGYSKVHLDRVADGWEDLDLYIPGGEGEKELLEMVHQWICWPKCHIRLKQDKTDSAECSRPRSPTPANREQSVNPPSPSAAREPSMDPTSPPAARPSPPPPKRRQKISVAPPPPPKQKKQKQLKQHLEPFSHEKPVDQMTPEEIDADLKATSRAFFAAQKEKKKPPPPLQVDPAAKAFFIKQASRGKKSRESDYDRTVRKLHKIPENRRSSSRSKSIPQLGEQSNQSIDQLVVASEEDAAMADFLASAGITKAQLLGTAPMEVHKGPTRKPFVLGEPLVWAELMPHLSTRMHEFHQWYLRKSQDGLVMFALRIKDEHLLRGAHDIWIDFEMMWYLFHQDALDKALICAWVM